MQHLTRGTGGTPNVVLGHVGRQDHSAHHADVILDQYFLEAADALDWAMEEEVKA